jgi:hypothetical protein
MRVLVAGWFSLPGMGCTAGDVLARDVACGWLDAAGIPHDVATVGGTDGGVSLDDADPARYSHVAFVCGPFRDTAFCNELLARFSGCQLIGLDLSMLTDGWNPFDVLIERDSCVTARPDLVFGSDQALVPVVGLLLVHPQPQYGDRARHALVEAAIADLLDDRPAAIVRIDTLTEDNASGLRSAAEIESLIARMDLVVTTRLHGLVLALKNGVPAVAVDPVAGGDKVSRQAAAVGWPHVLRPEEVSSASLAQVFDRCATEAARDEARRCAIRGRLAVEAIGVDFVEAVRSTATPSSP